MIYIPPNLPFTFLLSIKLYFFRLFLYINYQTIMKKYSLIYEQNMNISTHNLRVLILFPFSVAFIPPVGR